MKAVPARAVRPVAAASAQVQVQLALPAEWATAVSLLDRFEARLRDLHMAGLTLWTGVLRTIVQRVLAGERARRERAYQQLMLLEHELTRAAPRAKLLARIGGIKGLLAGVALGALVYQACCDGGALRPVRGRGRRRDDVAELCLAGTEGEA